ncbi:MAG: dihydroorotase [Bacteroidales bacterium]|nr:dihydroorotase [Bacteroidales bacterium]MBR5055320.1 dihydroorotase [Bacteroidales bacterium]
MAGNTILLRGGEIVAGAQRTTGDILVRDGRIEAIRPGLPVPDGAEVIDLAGKTVVPAFVDIHVHFREPGFTAKETIRTGSMAAARGGYTAVCAMPNLNPVPDSPETLAIEQIAIDRDAVISVLPYCSITKGRKGLELVDFKTLKGSCVAFSDDGSGVQDEAMMRSAMEAAAREDVIIAAHCEDNSLLRGGYIHDGRYAAMHGHKGICSESEWGQIARDLELCEETGCHYHVCHISTKESVGLIRKAKARGVNVTCETAPHYLVLCENDLQEDGRFKMNPPLRSAEDREVLLEGLLDGTIDAIATDHAPHTAEEKSRGLAGSAMGIVGLETSFPVLYTSLVRTGKVSLERLVEAMSTAPRRIFRIGGALEPGQPADIAVLDLENEFTIDSNTFLSKGRSTPFDGWKVRGRVLMTFKDGKVIYNNLTK